MKRINRPYRVSEPVVRGVALQVLILSVLSILTGSYIPLVLLAADFFTRALIHPKWSPLARISERIIVPLQLFRRKQVVFKPKRFAAFIGLTLTLASLSFHLFGIRDVTIYLLLLLAFFSFLEAFFRFCAGCKIFGLLIKLKLVKEDECPDCVYLDGSGI